jgi:hypothetical protein
MALGCSGYCRLYRKSISQYLPICICFGIISLVIISSGVVHALISPEKRWNDASQAISGMVVGYDFINPPKYQGLVNISYLGDLTKEIEICELFLDLCSDTNLTRYKIKLSEKMPLYSNLTCYYDPRDPTDVRLALKHVDYLGTNGMIGIYLGIPSVIGLLALLASILYFFVCEAPQFDYVYVPEDPYQSSSIESI